MGYKVLDKDYFLYVYLGERFITLLSKDIGSCYWHSPTGETMTPLNVGKALMDLGRRKK